MAKKSTSKKTRPENGFDKLARLIKSEGDDIRSDMDKGFASVRTEMRVGFAKVAEQFVEVHGELRAIRHEISEINHPA